MYVQSLKEISALPEVKRVEVDWTTEYIDGAISRENKRIHVWSVAVHNEEEYLDVLLAIKSKMHGIKLNKSISLHGTHVILQSCDRGVHIWLSLMGMGREERLAILGHLFGCEIQEITDYRKHVSVACEVK